MPTPLITYILKGWKDGLSSEQIASNLRASGWNNIIIRQALLNAARVRETGKRAPIIHEQSKRDTKRTLRSWLLLLLAPLGALLLIGLFAAAEYAGIIPTSIIFERPETLWNAFVTQPSSHGGSFELSIRYEDGIKSNQSNDGVKVLLSGGIQGRESEQNKLEASGTIHIEVADNQNSRSISIPFVYLDDASKGIFADIKKVNAGSNETAAPEWVTAKTPPEVAAILQTLLSLPGSVTNNPVVTGKTFIGWEKLNGVQAGRYALTLNHEQLTKNIITNQALAGFAVNTIELWVADKTAELLKIQLTTNAPSLKNISILEERQAVIASADAKRLNDIRQIAHSLEAYYNDHGGYPNMDAGKPIGLTPGYLPAYLEAPKAHGICSDYINTYWYRGEGKQGKSKRTGEKTHQSYSLTFCLEHPIENFSAGVTTAHPRGITTSGVCPAEQPDCFSSEKVEQLLIPDKPLEFGAYATIDINILPTSRVEPIIIPEKATPLRDFIASILEKNRAKK